MSSLDRGAGRRGLWFRPSQAHLRRLATELGKTPPPALHPMLGGGPHRRVDQPGGARGVMQGATRRRQARLGANGRTPKECPAPDLPARGEGQERQCLANVATPRKLPVTEARSRYAIPRRRPRYIDWDSQENNPRSEIPRTYPAGTRRQCGQQNRRPAHGSRANPQPVGSLARLKLRRSHLF